MGGVRQEREGGDADGAPVRTGRRYAICPRLGNGLPCDQQRHKGRRLPRDMGLRPVQCRDQPGSSNINSIILHKTDSCKAFLH